MFLCKKVIFIHEYFLSIAPVKNEKEAKIILIVKYQVGHMDNMEDQQIPEDKISEDQKISKSQKNMDTPCPCTAKLQVTDLFPLWTQCLLEMELYITECHKICL